MEGRLKTSEVVKGRLKRRDEAVKGRRRQDSKP